MLRNALIATIVVFAFAIAISSEVDAGKVTPSAPCKIEHRDLEDPSKRRDAAVGARLKGQVAMHAGDYACAILYLKESIRITGPDSPYSFTSQTLLATAYGKLGLNDEVEEMWGRLLENYDGGNDLHRTLRARILIRLGKHFLRRDLDQKAERVFLEVVNGPADGHWRFDIAREQAFRLLAKLYKAQAKLPKALEANGRLIETIEARPEPTTVDVEDLVIELEERARLLELMGRTEDASRQRRKIGILRSNPI